MKVSGKGIRKSIIVSAVSLHTTTSGSASKSFAPLHRLHWLLHGMSDTSSDYCVLCQTGMIMDLMH